MPIPSQFQVNKYLFFKGSNYSKSTEITNWNLYMNYIADIENESNKDLYDFGEDEIKKCNEKVTDLSDSILYTFNSFIKFYLKWYSKSYHKELKEFKLKRKNKVDNSWYISKYNFFNLCRKIFEANGIDNVLPLILARYGITGQKMIYARQIKWKDIDFKNKEVIIFNEEEEIILHISVDSDFLKWMDLAKEIHKKKYIDFNKNIFHIIKGKNHEIVNYDTLNSRIYKACKVINIKRIALYDLESSARMDYLYELYNGKYDIDFVTIEEKFKIWYPKEIICKANIYKIMHIFFNWLGAVEIEYDRRKKVKKELNLLNNEETKHTKVHKNLIIECGDIAYISIKRNNSEVKVIIDKEDISKVSKYQWLINISGFIITRINKDGVTRIWHLSNFVLDINDYYDIKYRNEDKLDCRKVNLIIDGTELRKEG